MARRGWRAQKGTLTTRHRHRLLASLPINYLLPICKSRILIRIIDGDFHLYQYALFIVDSSGKV